MKPITRFGIAVALGGAAVGCTFAIRRLIQDYREALEDEEEGSAFKAALLDLGAPSVDVPRRGGKHTTKAVDLMMMATTEDRSPTHAEFALIEMARTAGWPASNDTTQFGISSDGHVVIRMLTDYGHVQLERTTNGSSFFITKINDERPPEALRGFNLPFTELEKIYG